MVDARLGAAAAGSAEFRINCRLPALKIFLALRLMGQALNFSQGFDAPLLHILFNLPGNLAVDFRSFQDGGCADLDCRSPGHNHLYSLPAGADAADAENGNVHMLVCLIYSPQGYRENSRTGHPAIAGFAAHQGLACLDVNVQAGSQRIEEDQTVGAGLLGGSGKEPDVNLGTELDEDRQINGLFGGPDRRCHRGRVIPQVVGGKLQGIGKGGDFFRQLFNLVSCIT